MQIWRYHICIDKQVSHPFSYLSYHQTNNSSLRMQMRGLYEYAS